MPIWNQKGLLMTDFRNHIVLTCSLLSKVETITEKENIADFIKKIVKLWTAIKICHHDHIVLVQTLNSRKYITKLMQIYTNNTFE